MKMFAFQTEKQLLEACIENNQPVLLIGETGTGKTTFIKHLAEEKGKEMIRINLNGQTGREDLIGKYQLVDGDTVWQDGILLTAIRKGYWILLDEINAALPEVLLVLQALLEVHEKTLGKIVLSEKDGEAIAPHPDTRLFATCNPSDYMGTKDFNQATLSRFVILPISHLSQTEEAQLLQDKYALEQEDARRIAMLAYELRKLKHEDKLTTFTSTRDVEQYAQLRIAKIAPELAIKIAITQKGSTTFEQESIEAVAARVMQFTPKAVREEFDICAAYKDLLTEHEQLNLQVVELKKHAASIEDGTAPTLDTPKKPTKKKGKTKLFKIGVRFTDGTTGYEVVNVPKNSNNQEYIVRNNSNGQLTSLSIKYAKIAAEAYGYTLDEKDYDSKIENKDVVVSTSF